METVSLLYEYLQCRWVSELPQLHHRCLSNTWWKHYGSSHRVLYILKCEKNYKNLPGRGIGWFVWIQDTLKQSPIGRFIDIPWSQEHLVDVYDVSDVRYGSDVINVTDVTELTRKTGRSGVSASWYRTILLFSLHSLNASCQNEINFGPTTCCGLTKCAVFQKYRFLIFRVYSSCISLVTHFFQRGLNLSSFKTFYLTKPIV